MRKKLKPRIFKLTAVDTEQRTNRVVEYTSSKLKAQAWIKLEKIQFSDSSHGIVFLCDEVTKRDERVMDTLGFYWFDNRWLRKKH